MTKNDKFILFLIAILTVLFGISLFLLIENHYLKKENLEVKKIALEENQEKEDFREMVASLNLELDTIEDVYQLIKDLNRSRK